MGRHGWRRGWHLSWIDIAMKGAEVSVAGWCEEGRVVGTNCSVDFILLFIVDFVVLGAPFAVRGHFYYSSCALVL